MLFVLQSEVFVYSFGPAFAVAPLSLCLSRFLCGVDSLLCIPLIPFYLSISISGNMLRIKNP